MTANHVGSERPVSDASLVIWIIAILIIVAIAWKSLGKR